MNGIELRKGIITNLANEITDKQLATMLAMRMDMESTFEERKEEIVIFNSPHIGYIGVSFIDSKLRFIKCNGTAESATRYIGNKCYYETMLQIWHAFHNDR
jgi:hypothetical protein